MSENSSSRNDPLRIDASPHRRRFTAKGSIRREVFEQTLFDGRANDRAQEVDLDRFRFKQPHRRWRPAHLADPSAILIPRYLPLVRGELLDAVEERGPRLTRRSRRLERLDRRFGGRRMARPLRIRSFNTAS